MSEIDSSDGTKIRPDEAACRDLADIRNYQPLAILLSRVSFIIHLILAWRCRLLNDSSSSIIGDHRGAARRRFAPATACSSRHARTQTATSRDHLSASMHVGVREERGTHTPGEEEEEEDVAPKEREGREEEKEESRCGGEDEARRKEARRKRKRALWTWEWERSHSP